MRRFKLLWAFSYLYEWIKTRGRSTTPCGLIVDEFAHMTQKVAGGTNPLAQDLDTFINVYMRQHTIWFTAAHQELYQIDEQLRNTLLSLGTYILGATSSIESARTLADALFLRDPWWVKHYRAVWGRPTSRSLLQVIAEEPEFMKLEEQTELFAQQIKSLGRFQFLFRPAVAEGHIGSAVLPLSIRQEDVDPENGKYQFPDAPLMARLRAALAKQSGIPVQAILKEQEKRIPPVLPETTWRLVPPQPRQTGSQPRQRQPQTDGHREQRLTNVSPAEPPQTTPEKPAILPSRRPLHQRRYWRS
jgi:hypothetical protein